MRVLRLTHGLAESAPPPPVEILWCSPVAGPKHTTETIWKDFTVDPAGIDVCGVCSPPPAKGNR